VTTTPLNHPRTSRRALLAVVAGVFALAAALLPGVQAHAAPSVTDLQAQIDQKWNQLEPLVEKYDSVHSQLQANLTKQATLTKQLGPLQTQVSLSQVRVGAMSAQLYMNGPGSNLNALLESGSPEDLADELASLNQLAKNQQRSVDAVQAQVEQYSKQKQALDLLVAQQKQQDASLNAQKNQINGQITQLTKLRDQAYGSSSNHGNTRPVACPYSSSSGAGHTAAVKACSLINKPYGWGDAGPNSYDCSGMTMTAWKAAGVSLDHNAKAQYDEIKQHLTASELQPGDLVFYGSDFHHVALYIGGGYVVHAPTTGDVVREAKMTEVGSNLHYARP
jgi:cell wall-associated NlpC family hydrolase